MRTVDKITLIDQRNEMESESSSEEVKYKEVFKEPPKWIRNSVIILITTILCTSVLATMALHIICSNFNWYNIFSAKLQFKEKTEAEIGHILNKINSPNFNIESLTNDESKFVYEEDLKIHIEDLKFLIKMKVDKSSTVWHRESITSYLLKYPEASEAIAIIWLIMTIIYQCGNNDSNWSIPQGWRIVVPSLVVFFIMGNLSTILAVLGTKSISHFCFELKKELKHPELVRCGLAISHLRLQRESHEFIFDTILNIYNHMNYAKAFCWFLAFVVILLRFIFAIDFQLIELRMVQYDKRNIKKKHMPSDSFEPLPADIEMLRKSTLYDNSTELSISNEQNVTKSDDKPTVTYKEKPSDDKGQTFAKLRHEYDDDTDDFQSANSIMIRTPLMASGDYVDDTHNN